MIPVLEQVRAFGSVVLTGVLIGFLLDLYRSWRWLVKPGRLGTGMGDVLFWLVVTPTALAILLWSNNGDLRGYVLLGMFLGWYAYARYLSFRVQSGTRRFWVVAGRTWSVVIRMVLWPLAVVVRIVRVPLLAASLGLWHALRVIRGVGRLPVRLVRGFRRRFRWPKG